MTLAERVTYPWASKWIGGHVWESGAPEEVVNDLRIAILHSRGEGGSVARVDRLAVGTTTGRLIHSRTMLAVLTLISDHGIALEVTEEVDAVGGWHKSAGLEVFVLYASESIGGIETEPDGPFRQFTYPGETTKCWCDFIGFVAVVSP